MGTKLSNLSPARGAKKKPRRRLGRGYGSGNGTTAGKGQKGQLSRAGVTLGRGFEGGQMPLQRRLPKRGFRNIFRQEYAAVNIGQLAKVFEPGQQVDPDMMRSHGLAPRKAKLLKVLGNGQLSHALVIKAHAFSQSAREKIQTAGGSVEVLQTERGARQVEATVPPMPVAPPPQTPQESGVDTEQA